MKKTLAIILAALMLCLMSIPAMAADTVINQTLSPSTGNTLLSYSVSASYQVTIPEGVTFNATSKEGTLTVSVAENAFIAYNKSIKIKLTTCDFELANNDDSLTYTIKDRANLTPNEIAVNGEVHTHAAGTLTASSSTLDLKIVDSAKYAGEYTDTITFTVSVE